MIGTIERQVRRLSIRVAVPMMVVAIGASVPDPTHRATGYGGVLPLPAPSPTIKLDPLLQQHREHPPSRGRVLYAPGHEPRAASSSSPAATVTAANKPVRPVCPDQRVSQRGHPAPAPAS